MKLDKTSNCYKMHYKNEAMTNNLRYHLIITGCAEKGRGQVKYCSGPLPRDLTYSASHGHSKYVPMWYCTVLYCGVVCYDMVWCAVM